MARSCQLQGGPLACAQEAFLVRLDAAKSKQRTRAFNVYVALSPGAAALPAAAPTATECARDPPRRP